MRNDFCSFTGVMTHPTKRRMNTSSRPIHDDNARPATRSVGGRRLLVVDDDDLVRSVLQRLLTRAGHHVTAVTDGRHAMERLVAAPFDAVISDVDMDQVDGIQLLQHVREQHPSVPVILLTGRACPPVLEAAERHGAVACLPKPVDRSRLLELVGQVTAARTVADADEVGTLHRSTACLPMVSAMSALLANAS